MDDQRLHGPSLLQSLWRYRWVVVVLPMLTGLLGYLLATQQTPSYDASALLFLSDPGRTPGLDDRPGNRINPNEYVPQQAARASTRAVYEAAQQTLPSPPSLREMMQSISIRESVTDLSLTITATSTSAEGAAALANAMATGFMAVNVQSEREAADGAVLELEQQSSGLEDRLVQLQEQFGRDPENLVLQSQIQDLSLRRIELDRLISTVRIEASLRGDGVDELEAAAVPRSPARPRARLQAVMFAFMGAVVAGLWTYWFAGRSQRVLTRTDPEAVLGVPLLGEIPLYRNSSQDPLAGVRTADLATAEAYEFVLSSVEFALADSGGTALMITSALPGDGKTTTALHLAVAASRDRRRVILVDADVRAGGLSRALGSEARLGLADAVVRNIHPGKAMSRHQITDEVQIPVVTAGQRRGDPTALLRTQSFRRAMGDISDDAELVVIDTSPLLAVADATIVAACADGVVLVVTHGTPFSELERVRERLRFVSTPLLGYIFNRSEAPTAATYGYGHGTSDAATGWRRLLPRRGRRGSRVTAARPVRPRLPTEDLKARADQSSRRDTQAMTRVSDGPSAPSGQAGWHRVESARLVSSALPASARPLILNASARRAPLTEPCIEALLGADGGLYVVLCSSALGSEGVTEVLVEAGHQQPGLDVFNRTAIDGTITPALPKGAHRSLLLLNLPEGDPAAAAQLHRSAQEAIGSRRKLIVVMISPAAHYTWWAEMLTHPDPLVRSSIVKLRRWDGDALRGFQQHEAIVSDADDFVSETLEQTSGWPLLLNRAHDHYLQNGHWGKAVEHVREQLDDIGHARSFLDEVGLPLHGPFKDVLATWIDIGGVVVPSTFASTLAHIAEVKVPPGFLGVLDSLGVTRSVPAGLALDPVVLHAWTTLKSEP